MSLYLHSYNKALRSYDPDLFAGHTRDGVLCVFRKHKRFEAVCEWEGGKLMTLTIDKQFIFAVTDNWKVKGKPRDWGIDQVLCRVREIDTLANEKFFEEMDAQNEKVDESRKRDLKNEMEGFWAYERKRFARATDDILTHSLSKDEPRKRLKDRSIKNGNN